MTLPEDGWAEVFLANYPWDSAAVDVARLQRDLEAIAKQLGDGGESELFDEFVAVLGSRGGKDATAPLAAIVADDLYLAFLAERGVKDALERFDSDCLRPVIGIVTRRMGLSKDEGDELAQRLRLLLFVDSETSSAKIRDYSGKGAIKAWLRVVAFRLGLRMRRQDPAQRSDELDEEQQESDVPITSSDPELALVKRRYGAVFATAMEEAIAALSAKERLILRQYFVDRLTIDEIAKLHGTHRSSAHRWVQSAQARMSQECRQRVVARLPMTESDVERLCRDMASKLSINLSHLLPRG